MSEPANYSGQCDACRSIYEGTKAECKARICRECISQPAEVPACGVETRVCGWPMFAVVRDGKPLYAHPLKSAARNYATGFSDAQIVEGAFAPIEARIDAKGKETA